MPFKQHCFKVEGVLYFVYSAYHRKCSKTFGRHCRFNKYKSVSRKFSGGVLLLQTEPFRHFTEAGQHRFLEDISFPIINRVSGVSRHKEGFWQFRLQSFMPE